MNQCGAISIMAPELFAAETGHLASPRSSASRLRGSVLCALALSALLGFSSVTSAVAGSLVAADPVVADPRDDIVPQTDITVDSVAAVNGALEYLARTQDPATGAWLADVGYKLNQNYEVSARRKPHVGVTAMAALAFLSAGHLPGRGEYGDVISRATDYILSCMLETGHITRNGSRMYSHAFATLYLAEVYGMTDRYDLNERLQRAVDFIVDCQNEYGSWRYEPHAAESDMSITVCQLNALRAARNVGIRVPKSTIDRAAQYISASYVDRDSDPYRYQGYYRLGRGSFKYQATRHTRSSFALTAAGLAALHNAGVNGLKIESDGKAIDLRESIEFLRDSYGNVSGNSRYGFHFFYWYGHYYATQALYVIGGDVWDWYYPRLRDEIVASQRSDGSFPCRVGPGEAFSTAAGAVILSLPYGYLPIFQR
ncbi:MAG: terpene cyclase/mutase family protein [Planctomycetota bacterium]|nr:terpene cyclase/mutase family protein [Planctomycetota bacterium]